MTNQQLTVQTLDLISDACQNACEPLKQDRERILEYALELATKAAPVYIFQILKAQADLCKDNEKELFYVSMDAWLTSSKLVLDHHLIA